MLSQVHTSSLLLQACRSIFVIFLSSQLYLSFGQYDTPPVVAYGPPSGPLADPIGPEYGTTPEAGGYGSTPAMVPAGSIGPLDPRSNSKGSGVKFFLYFNPHDTELYDEIQLGNPDSLGNSAYNVSRPVKFLVHGAGSDSKTPDDVRVIKDAYLKYCLDSNILMVDYSGATMSPVFQNLVAMLRTKQIAKEISDFVEFLIKAQSLGGAKYVHVIGFGLGAHVAGTVGRTVKGALGENIGRITGLDPMMRKKLPFSQYRLDPSDAEFVDVTHTALRKFTVRRRGHVRFYVNGGAHQPKCPRIFGRSCNHHTAIRAFAKSIQTPESILGCRCLSIFCRSPFFNANSCVDPIPYGECVNKTSRGSYFVNLD